MKVIVARMCALGVLATLAGCNSLGGVPEFKSTSIAPATLHAGDTALITIEVKDKNEIIHAISGVIKEAPDITLALHDDGEEGDVKANDDTWSLAVQVPPKVAPGNFSLTFTAYRSDGVPVPIRGAGGEITALSAVMPLTISFKQ